MGNQYESQNPYYNKNLDNMNSLVFNQNSNNDILTLSKPVSSESNQGPREDLVQKILIDNIENNPTRDLSKNNELNDKHINIKKENVNKLNNIHSEKKFISKKKGRPRKGQENQSNRNHTNISYDNARRKIINSCKKSIYDLIEQKIPKKSDIKLHIPTIEHQMGYSSENIKKFLDKTLYDIFCDSKPKKLKDEIKNNPEQYQHNKNNIDMLLKNELKGENKQIKILKGLFNLCFKDFLKAYLNDEKEIKINDEIIISLDGFKTFDSYFNEIYNEKLKTSFKTKILAMLDNK